MLGEQCEYYNDIYYYLEDMIKFDKDRILKLDERNLLKIRINNKINTNLKVIITVSIYMNKEKKKERFNYLPFNIEYKQKLMIELEENWKRFIDLYLLPKTNDEQNKIFL